MTYQTLERRKIVSDLSKDSIEETFDPDIYVKKLSENTKLSIQMFDKAQCTSKSAPTTLMT